MFLSFYFFVRARTTFVYRLFGASNTILHTSMLKYPKLVLVTDYINFNLLIKKS